MRILLVNTHEHAGGAAIAAKRLHAGLEEAGATVSRLVQLKRTDAAGVIGPSTPLQREWARFRPDLDRLPLKLYPGYGGKPFSTAWFPDGLVRRVRAQAPDIVHLHWVAHGFLRPESLAGLGAPIVWTLHDSWPFTGGCHLPSDCTRYREACGSCPQLGSHAPHDLSYRLWRRKRDAWQGLRLHVISPSHWLARQAASSSLLHDRPVQVIPNGVDTRCFKPRDRQWARDALGLPQAPSLILFGAVNALVDANKGAFELATALRRLQAMNLPNAVELVVAGASKPARAEDFGLPVHYMGHLQDETSMAMLYAAVDAHVLPSRHENLPNTILEAMACGTPCVAFGVGGVPEMIDHGSNGFLATPGEADGLAHGLAWLLADPDRRRQAALEARGKIEREFALEQVSQRHLQFYAEMLGHPQKS